MTINPTAIKPILPPPTSGRYPHKYRMLDGRTHKKIKEEIEDISDITEEINATGLLRMEA